MIGLLKEQQKQLGNAECEALLEAYERKSFELRDVLFHANRNPDTCANLTAARIDILEMIGGSTNLEQVSQMLCWHQIVCAITCLKASG